MSSGGGVRGTSLELPCSTTPPQVPGTSPVVGTFNMNAKRLYLTYAQCPLSQDEVYAQTKRLLPPIAFAVIACEKHLDGSPHVHALIVLKEKKHFRTSRILDLVKDTKSYHPNLQAVKIQAAVLKYIMKDGPQSVRAYGVDLQSLLGKRGNAMSQAAQILLDGGTMEHVLGELPSFVLQHLRKLKDFVSYLEERKRRRIASFARLLFTAESSAGCVSVVLQWLKANLGDLQAVRPHKTKALWIHSHVPNVGKTSMAINLATVCKVYVVPDEMYFNDYTEGYDVAIIDEVHGLQPIWWLNKFAAGEPMKLTCKMDMTLFKKKNIPLIVLGNKSPAECYANHQELIPMLEARFEVVYVSEGEYLDIKMEGEE